MSLRKFSILISTLLIVLSLVYYFYPDKSLPEGSSIDKIVVIKSEKQLLAYVDGRLIKTYQISLGANSNGDKEFEGDNKTPEGLYFINDKNPHSGYHKNLGISYPNKKDAEDAVRSGKPAGGNIKIHGIRNNIGFLGRFHRWFNWTQGCIAVTNDEIDELYKAVKIGTPIEIKP